MRIKDSPYPFASARTAMFANIENHRNYIEKASFWKQDESDKRELLKLYVIGTDNDHIFFERKVTTLIDCIAIIGGLSNPIYITIFLLSTYVGGAYKKLNFARAYQDMSENELIITSKD